MVWSPGDPWPDTTYSTRGAVNPAWSGYVRLCVQANIDAGKPFTMGPDPADRLNAGNVLWYAGTAPLAGASLSGLWVDLACDITDMDVTLGATATQGLLTKVEAGQLSCTLYDPDGRYDPLNPDTPFAISGRTRLLPGVPIQAWIEVINNPTATPPYTVNRFPLFQGTADSWTTTWEQYPGERTVKLVATDTTKLFVKMDREEQPPTGGGDSTGSRLQRIATFFGWPGAIVQGDAGYFPPPTGGVAYLQATTLAQSAWELFSRALDDELGFGFFRPQAPATAGTWQTYFIWWSRLTWTDDPHGNLINIGCPPADDPTPQNWFDIAVDAKPQSFDSQLHNAVYASRSGGTMVTVKNAHSIDLFGEQNLNRTDLGLLNETYVSAWANTIVSMSAYPQTILNEITLEPALDGIRYQSRTGSSGDNYRVWQPNYVWIFLLQVAWVVGKMHVRFDAGYTVELDVRILGWKHHITPQTWEITYYTTNFHTVPSSATFHLGPHAQDHLDSGWLLGG